MTQQEQNEAPPASPYGMTLGEALAIFDTVMGGARTMAFQTLQSLSDPTLTDAQKLDAVIDRLTQEIQQAKHVMDNYATRGHRIQRGRGRRRGTGLAVRRKHLHAEAVPADWPVRRAGVEVPPR